MVGGGIEGKSAYFNRTSMIKAEILPIGVNGSSVGSVCASVCLGVDGWDKSAQVSTPHL